ncbi:hypothetical protein INT46_010045 [Mucor plumbeus]|uniref:Uncharacterized protein n=1 Tax=Mucor plumbeus TaxID=97098 RepID=A0A8H7QM66_9FUNG|nr:hypothetical protein INT46_010045 [Mucor plumbeus]
MSNNQPEISSPENYQKYMKSWNYNQVLKHGNRIDISGQGGWDRNLDNGYIFPSENLEGEIEQAFINVEHVLNSVGSSWKDVYNITSYHKNIGTTGEVAYAAMIKLMRKYIGERSPLWTSVGVEGLADPRMNIEIVVTAYTD